MEFLVFAVIFGIIAGLIAQSKGRSFLLWAFYGTMIAIVAIPHALLLKPTRKVEEATAAEDGYVKCPACAEMVKREARICKHCRTELTPQAASEPGYLG